MFEAGFPGHMAKAKRTVAEHIRLVDLVVEVLDARAPRSTVNPDIARLTGQKPRVVVLNKADLADPAVTGRWLKYLRGQGVAAVSVSAAGGQGMKEFGDVMRRLAEPARRRLAEKGIRRPSARAMIVGIPNVGKSRLINRLVGKAAARTGDKPGVTRGKQWVRIGGNFELLDTPGVLCPQLQEETTINNLALLGVIGAGEYDPVAVVLALLAFLAAAAPLVLQKRYGLDSLAPVPADNLAALGRKRGCLGPGGSVDTTKAAALIIRDFQTGCLGRLSLDLPPETGTDADPSGAIEERD
ncbi:MAG: ribosome biogenesis GTPase YlqF [bacterium]|jgi:ribosome biogenesis GTPase A